MLIDDKSGCAANMGLQQVGLDKLTSTKSKAKLQFGLDKQTSTMCKISTSNF